MQRTLPIRAHPKVAVMRRATAAGAMRVQCSAFRAHPFVSAPIIHLAASAAAMVNGAMHKAKLAALETTRGVDQEELNQQIKGSLKQMHVLALVAPFAAVSGSADTFLIITKAVASFIKLYLLLLFVRVLLSWFPTFTWWEDQPWLALRQVTDPYLKLFQGLVPPLLGTIDLTPLFGFFILQFLAGALDVADGEARYWS